VVSSRSFRRKSAMVSLGIVMFLLISGSVLRLAMRMLQGVESLKMAG